MAKKRINKLDILKEDSLPQCISTAQGPLNEQKEEDYKKVPFQIQEEKPEEASLNWKLNGHTAPGRGVEPTALDKTFYATRLNLSNIVEKNLCLSITYVTLSVSHITNHIIHSDKQTFEPIKRIE